MIGKVVARAYANIALAKYWGKQSGLNKVPATPSISLALDNLLTETTIERSHGSIDTFILNGAPADSVTTQRLIAYLDFWRERALVKGSFKLSSINKFPTASGLASSASGYAALAAGLSKISGKRISKKALSRLARIGSGSAARSITGGLSALPLSKDPSARLILPPEKIKWGMVIAVVQGGAKEIGSTRGMELSRKTSPYYKAWLSQAKKDYCEMLSAIRKQDFGQVGRLTEDNCFAMHACMIATRPSLRYWNPTTLEVIRSVHEWREDGLETYITIDAGHHVALLTPLENLEEVAARVGSIAGVEMAIQNKPAGGAEILEWE